MPDMSDSRRSSSPVDRIGSLANLPVFVKLDGKRVVLVGGSEAALWKAELLAAAGAVVEVYADTLAAGFDELSSRLLKGRVNLVRRTWTPSDLACAALAVGSLADEAEAEAFASAARAAGVPVNVVDRPSLCDFQFGAIVNLSLIHI
jgi:uroporphyrin-III C-methyltransferase/precorrin-2 dehydrogenase/sirohydrochlorin ferrochelatase